ncbi:V-type ATP synthase subunit I [Dorea sp. D27]|uniref:V-type ATP synthase subunit I n=1 Tax=Dorea sp. D27 TaxID=658665 RepID=UPI000673BFD4|nr:V-type ATPase 116kDa subunit family protein [Dorea sp. D27]KMZ54571.1 putative V-type sodium ATP synthase subunit I [Dorea sp. D27]
MIVKMKFLSISGPRTDIDRVCDVYLSKYEMQLENAVTELKTTDNLLPFVEMNPYKEPLAKAEEFTSKLSVSNIPADTSLSTDDIITLIRELNHDYLELQEKKELLKKNKDELLEKLHVLEPFRPLDFDLHKVLHYRYMQLRFGRIGIDYYRKLEKYLFEDLNAIFLEGTRDENYVYGCYFVANAETSKVDSVFNSLHFERITISDEYIGTPSVAYDSLEEDISDLDDRIADIDKSIQDLLNNQASQLLGARKRLEELSNNFDVRKMAARVDDNKEDYYILCGWMGVDDVEAFLRESEGDDKVFVVVEEDREKFFGDPPTKLKNPRFFKPFEMFIRMYGLPSSNEMDPTVFVALTYTFIFGAMFGDVGQGLCLFVIGGLLYKLKNINLAGIISVAGLFSAFFGFMFGSVFGFEDIIQARWLRPMEAMTNLPFIGQLNTVFIVAIAFGMGLNILSMIFHIINAIRAKDTENIWFSNNGIAGLVFYGFIVFTIVLYMTGHQVPGNILMAVFLGIPILVFIFKEPLTNLAERNHKKLQTSKGMFLVQGFFELFETLLSYFSNTLSFVRIGAFAVSHAAIMEVVLMLSGAQEGSPNWLVVVIGNLVVCGLEGLIVGIQVLRLEYYEMFSRFYKGSGREFKPFNNHKKQDKN